MANLPIRLQPGAAVDRIEGWEADPEGRRVLKVRVRARPIDGEANDALIRLLAKSLGVSKSSVTVVRGGQSRSKMVVVDGLDDETLGARIAEILSDD
ncbi:DUF167 domain-containing protein [Brevundimonas sp. DWR2-3-1b1]|uniref:DUF167 domain-containing protein n=1 Tax=unclassified Brevundimonas TaxID=2622653 RepID=UPI003CF0F004